MGEVGLEFTDFRNWPGIGDIVKRELFVPAFVKWDNSNYTPSCG